MVYLFYRLTDLFFFILFLSSGVIYGLFSGSIFFYFGVSRAFREAVLVVLSAILLPIKSPIISTVFFIVLVETLLRVSVADCLP